MFHIARRLARFSFCFALWLLFTSAVGALRVEPPWLREEAPLAADWESSGFECLRREATAEDWIHCCSIWEYVTDNCCKQFEIHWVKVLGKVFILSRNRSPDHQQPVISLLNLPNADGYELGGVPCPV
jgi:hypothetical protein